MLILDWSMKTLFSGVIHNACPLAQSTTIRLIMPKDSGAYTLSPPGIADQSGHTFEIPKNTPLDLGVKWESQHVDNNNPGLAPVKIHRYLGGTGQEEGSINVEFQNTLSTPIEIVYFESIPWILRIWLHSLKLVTNNGTGF
jgi:phosphatidylinositol glycan class T